MATKFCKCRIPRMVIIYLILCAIFCAYNLIVNQHDVEAIFPILENVFQVQRFIEVSQEEEFCIKRPENDSVELHYSTMIKEPNEIKEYFSKHGDGENDIVYFVIFQKIIETYYFIGHTIKDAFKNMSFNEKLPLSLSHFLISIKYYASGTVTKGHIMLQFLNDKHMEICPNGTEYLCPTDFRRNQYLVYPIFNRDLLASYRNLTETNEYISFLTLAESGFAYSGNARILVCRGCNIEIDIKKFISDPNEAQYHNIGCPTLASPAALSPENVSATDASPSAEPNPAQARRDVSSADGDTNTSGPTPSVERETSGGTRTNVISPQTVQLPLPQSHRSLGQDNGLNCENVFTRALPESPDDLSATYVHGPPQPILNNPQPAYLPPVPNFGLQMRTERMFCQYCTERPAYYWVKPCSHICLCTTCSQSLTHCMICNKRFRELIVLRVAHI